MNSFVIIGGSDAGISAALHQGLHLDDLNLLDLSYTPPLSSPWDPVQMAAQA